MGTGTGQELVRLSSLFSFLSLLCFLFVVPSPIPFFLHFLPFHALARARARARPDARRGVGTRVYRDRYHPFTFTFTLTFFISVSFSLSVVGTYVASSLFISLPLFTVFTPLPFTIVVTRSRSLHHRHRRFRLRSRSLVRYSFKTRLSTRGLRPLNLSSVPKRGSLAYTRPYNPRFLSFPVSFPPTLAHLIDCGPDSRNHPSSPPRP
ncbi:hypothetical protein FA13DRAFT_1738996 [Coprinellus micaceus]|uniref:Uncharacterized protein n=1 Tax=Coprinellus micaceus TaxID=71717 RepID=A0A4Y7SSM3_COPMI|nr:hypothetical protein FA13DRAFT_1738996 [Coprinellus micaceus]